VSAPGGRLVHVELDAESFSAIGPDAEHERRVAIFDLIEENSFAPVGEPDGAFRLRIGADEARVVFSVEREDGALVTNVSLPVAMLRAVIRDYFTVCQSYYEAIRSAGPARIETLDMGRRALHDEGAETLREGLARHVAVDMNTARRLFTLICALRMRG
jgi:uncharacterized protein (UPF0262 family)